MAKDEALLEFSQQTGAPVLRLYAWSEPAATFGFFQRYRDVEQMTPLRPLVRRPTGGGLVPHDRDWTYSLTFPPSDAWFRLQATESYRRVHRWIEDSFRRLGIPVTLAPDRIHAAPGQCFAGAERFDVLFGNAKIAGAAQRRNKLGLLIQGSVQPPNGANRQDWEKALCDGREWEPFSAPPGWDERARQLAAEKYSRREYNERR